MIRLAVRAALSGWIWFVIALELLLECYELERKGINTALVEYTRKVDSAISEELKREVEIDIEALKSESATKLLTENGWEVKKLDEIEIVL